MTDRPGPARLVIREGLDPEREAAALRILHAAFAYKLRIGLDGPEDMVRLFAGQIDRSACWTAIVDGRLAGILTRQSNGEEFYGIGARRLLTAFWPLKTLRVLFNLLLLNESPPRNALYVESIAVDAEIRGLGIGGQLMARAETRARELDLPLLALDVIGDNHGAIRLYERLGYKITKTTRGFLVKFVTGSNEVHRMEKPLA